MSTPAGAIFSATRIREAVTPQRVRRPPGTPAGRRRPPLRGRPRGRAGRAPSRARTAREDVEGAEVAAVGDPQDPALEVVLAAVGGDPEPPQGAGDLAAVDVLRQLERGHHGRALVRVAEQLEAHRGDAGAGRAREQPVAGHHIVEALVLDHAERDVEPEEQRHRGRERARALALALRGAAPVEVVAAAAAGLGVLERALGDARERQPGRAHQRLLRAGHHDVDAPLVLPQLGGAEAGDGVEGEDRAVPGGDLGDRLDVVHDAGRGLAQRREHDLDVLVTQQPVDLRRVEPLAPARLVAHEIGAVGLAELDPALAELARRARQHLVAGADEVGDRRLHRARPARGEREHVVARAEHGRQPAEHALVQLVERRRAVVEHRRRHRLRDGGRHGRRPGGHQVLLRERVRRHRAAG